MKCVTKSGKYSAPIIWALVLIASFASVSYARAKAWPLMELVKKADIVAAAEVTAVTTKDNMLHCKLTIERLFKPSQTGDNQLTVIMQDPGAARPRRVRFELGGRYLVFLNYNDSGQSPQSLRLVDSVSGGLELKGDEPIRWPRILDGEPPRPRTFSEPELLERIYELIAGEPAQADAGTEADIRNIVAGNSEFAFELYAKLRDNPGLRETRGNLFFSPYSISTALAMTYAGARGDTEKQMGDVLRFSAPRKHVHRAFATLAKDLNAGGKKNGYELITANALWGQKGYGFLPEFLQWLKNYDARLEEVDFVSNTEEARRTINEWVERQTKKRIRQLVEPGALNILTRLVLTNAIYFKGRWEIQFDKSDTRDAPFTVSAQGEKVDSPMMQTVKEFKYYANDKVQIIELGYKGEDLSMIVLLPRATNGLEALEKSLTLGNVNGWLSGLQKHLVQVYLPRFKISSAVFELRGVLAAMGMKDAFSLPPADFSAMTGRQDLFISHVLHKAFVEVNEEGTEAAAATGAVATLDEAGDPPLVFRADHPFVFVIRDNHSGSILFMGRVADPTTQHN